MRQHHAFCNRRRFLKGAAGLAAAPAWVAAADSKRLGPDEFRKRLVGPILSFPTCYTVDFQLDFPAMRRIIDLGVRAGASLFTLTMGNNQYDRLSYDEIKHLTRFLVEAVAGRGMTMAATGQWWTGQAVAHARFAESAGVDALQVSLVPTGDDDGNFKHFRDVSAACRLPLTIHGKVSPKLMKRLVTLDKVAAYKEEDTTIETLPLMREFGERITFFAGGEKARLLTYYPYGMRAYYSDYATFVPHITRLFWKSVEAGDIKEAGRIVLRYGAPYSERWSHAFWRGTLEYFGVASRWLRPPQPTFTNEQMNEVKAFFQGLGLKPEGR